LHAGIPIGNLACVWAYLVLQSATYFAPYLALGE